MFIRNFLDDLNLNRLDIIYLVVLILFSLFITLKAINMNMATNIRSDVLVYLTNALFYSGLSENIHNTSNMYLSPVICYLTSLLINFGITGRESIFYVTGFFCIMANIAMYIFLKYRFNRLLSLLGAVLFGSFHIILTFWADGTLDVSVISLSIWTVIFIILAVYENPKYYILCFALVVLGIFTRYSAFFMIPVILLYFFSKNDFFNNIDLLLYDKDEFKLNAIRYMKSKEFRYIMLGIIIAVILFVWICNVITSYGSGLTFITQISHSLSGFEGPKYINETFGYQPNGTFYLENFLFLLNFAPIISFGINFSKIILILIVISLSLHLINLILNMNIVGKFISQKTDFKVKNFDKILWILFVIFALLFIYGLTCSHMLANVSMFVAMVILFSILDKFPISKKFYSMNFLCLAWFLVYFIFYSMINIKTYRYMISCIPPLVYFTIWSLDTIFRTLDNKFETNESFIEKHQRNLTFKFPNNKKGDYMKIAVMVLIGVLIVHGFSFESEYIFDKHDNSKLDKIFDFIIANDTDYPEKNISTDDNYYVRYGTWYLHKDIILNRTLFNGTPNDDYVLKNHPAENFTGYTRVVKTDKVHLYANNNNTVLLNFTKVKNDSKNIRNSARI